MIETRDEWIRISDEKGEIICWKVDQWINDPKLTPDIAHVIKKYYEEGPQAVRNMLTL